MESIIDNHYHASSTHFDEDIEKENLYGSMFESDDIDDEYIEFQEIKSDGNPISKADADDFHNSYYSPSVEDNNKYIGMKVLSPLKLPLQNKNKSLMEP